MYGQIHGSFKTRHDSYGRCFRQTKFATLLTARVINVGSAKLLNIFPKDFSAAAQSSVTAERLITVHSKHETLGLY